MPKKRIENLMSELHDTFGDYDVSKEQIALLKSVEDHIHGASELQAPEPSLLESLEFLITEIEEEHPKASAVVTEIVRTLRNIGV